MNTAIFAILIVYGTCCMIGLAMISDPVDNIRPGDSISMLWLRRGSQALVVVAAVACLQYVVVHNVEPWPPVVALLAALDFNISIRIVSVRRMNRYRGELARLD